MGLEAEVVRDERDLLRMSGGSLVGLTDYPDRVGSYVSLEFLADARAGVGHQVEAGISCVEGPSRDRLPGMGGMQTCSAEVGLDSFGRDEEALFRAAGISEITIALSYPVIIALYVIAGTDLPTSEGGRPGSSIASSEPPSASATSLQDAARC